MIISNRSIHYYFELKVIYEGQLEFQFITVFHSGFLSHNTICNYKRLKGSSACTITYYLTLLFVHLY